MGNRIAIPIGVGFFAVSAFRGRREGRGFRVPPPGDCRHRRCRGPALKDRFTPGNGECSIELLGGQHVVLRLGAGFGAMYRSNQTEAWTSQAGTCWTWSAIVIRALP